MKRDSVAEILTALKARKKLIDQAIRSLEKIANTGEKTVAISHYQYWGGTLGLWPLRRPGCGTVPAGQRPANADNWSGGERLLRCSTFLKASRTPSPTRGKRQEQVNIPLLIQCFAAVCTSPPS